MKTKLANVPIFGSKNDSDLWAVVLDDKYQLMSEAEATAFFSSLDIECSSHGGVQLLGPGAGTGLPLSSAMQTDLRSYAAKVSARHMERCKPDGTMGNARATWEIQKLFRSWQTAPV